MPYTMDNMPERIQGMPKHAQEIWIAAYNSASEQYGGDEGKCNATAWAAVERDYEKDAGGQWRKKAGKSADGAALKFVDAAETVIEGPGMPWGGPFNGQDIQREHFSAKTDFAFDWFPKDARPVLYQHGLDGETKTAPVGRVMDYEVKPDLGVWVKTQLDASSQYFGAIKELVRQGKLFYSSGSMRHLVETDGKTGEIKRWPWVEISLTPTPANPLATLDFATAEAHFAAVGQKAALHACKAMLEVAGKSVDLDKLTQDVRSAFMAEHRGTDAGMAVTGPEMWPSTVYDDAVIVSDKDRLYRVPYGKDADGKYQFAKRDQWQEVQLRTEYVPVPAKAAISQLITTCLDDDQATVKAFDEQTSLVQHADFAALTAAALLQRTKDLQDRRVKEGRAISTTNRKRLGDCLSSMRAAVDDLAALLDSTDPGKAEAKRADVRRLRAQLEASRLRSLTM